MEFWRLRGFNFFYKVDPQLSVFFLNFGEMLLGELEKLILTNSLFTLDFIIRLHICKSKEKKKKIFLS